MGLSLVSQTDVTNTLTGMSCFMSVSESLSLLLAYQPGGLLSVVPGAVSISGTIQQMFDDKFFHGMGGSNVYI